MNPDGSFFHSEDQTVNVTVRLKEDLTPGQDPGHFIDDGSRFRVHSVVNLTAGGPPCIVTARVTVSASGGFTGGEGFEAAGYVSNEGLTVGARGLTKGDVVTDSCLMHATGEQEDNFDLGDCLGRPAANQTPSRNRGRMFTFNCTTHPNMGSDVRVERWAVTGYVNLK